MGAGASLSWSSTKCGCCGLYGGEGDRNGTGPEATVATAALIDFSLSSLLEFEDSEGPEVGGDSGGENGRSCASSVVACFVCSASTGSLPDDGGEGGKEYGGGATAARRVAAESCLMMEGDDGSDDLEAKNLRWFCDLGGARGFMAVKWKRTSECRPTGLFV